MVDRIAEQVAQRLRQTIRVGSERAARNRPELEAPAREQAHPVPQLANVDRQVDRLDPQELDLLGLGQQQQIVHQAADPRDLGLQQSLDAAHLLAGRVDLGGQHFELAANHRQRRAQLVRGVRHERALARERVHQAVEHVIEGVGEDRHLVALPTRVVNARMQVARVHPRSHRGHPAQRPRQARADQIRGQQRAGERQQPGEDESAGDATLRAHDARQRLADADRHDHAPADTHAALEHPQIADVC